MSWSFSTKMEAELLEADGIDVPIRKARLLVLQTETTEGEPKGL